MEELSIDMYLRHMTLVEQSSIKLKAAQNKVNRQIEQMTSPARKREENISIHSLNDNEPPPTTYRKIG